MTTEEMLAARGAVHGDFTDHARITQALKDIVYDELVCRRERGQPPLSLVQREAIHMILHKIGRIVAGDADHADHWDDIAGYATLASKRVSVVNG